MLSKFSLKFFEVWVCLSESWKSEKTFFVWSLALLILQPHHIFAGQSCMPCRDQLMMCTVILIEFIWLFAFILIEWSVYHDFTWVYFFYSRKYEFFFYFTHFIILHFELDWNEYPFRIKMPCLALSIVHNVHFQPYSPYDSQNKKVSILSMVLSHNESLKQGWGVWGIAYGKIRLF